MIQGGHAQRQRCPVAFLEIDTLNASSIGADIAKPNRVVPRPLCVGEEAYIMADGLRRREELGISGDTPMAVRLLAFDWASTSAGDMASWPEEVLVLLRVAQRSATAMTLLLGHEGLVIPNDAAIGYLGSSYEGSVGQPLANVFPKGTRVAPILEACFAGASLKIPDTLIEIVRGGQDTHGWFSLSFTPIRAADGKVVGIFLVFSETTDRMQALQALHLARQRTDLALEAGSIVATWDFDAGQRTITLDGSILHAFGLSEEDARSGLSIDDVSLLLHPDDRQSVLAQLFAASEDEKEFSARFRAVQPDGNVRTMRALGRPVSGCEREGSKLAGVLLDVTREEEAAAALEQSDLRFDILAESVPQMVWSCDASGHRDYYNRFWSEFTGIALDEVTPETTKRLVHPDDWQRVEAHWAECMRTGAPYDIVYRYLRRDGHYRWLKVNSNPLRGADGQILRWYGTATDIDREKMLEVQRALVAKELDHRIKNLFAVASSLVALSVRENPELRVAAEGIQSRFRTLHEAHSLAFNEADGQSTPLQKILGTLLAPYTGSGAVQVDLSGDDPLIAARALTPVALILHELITNAAKYGAIKRDGVLRVFSKVKDAELLLTWEEVFNAAGAGAGAGASADGFGSRLIANIVNVQLKGAFLRELTPDGVRIRIALPLSAVISLH